MGRLRGRRARLEGRTGQPRRGQRHDRVDRTPRDAGPRRTLARAEGGAMYSSKSRARPYTPPSGRSSLAASGRSSNGTKTKTSTFRGENRTPCWKGSNLTAPVGRDSLLTRNRVAHAHEECSAPWPAAERSSPGGARRQWWLATDQRIARGPQWASDLPVLKKVRPAGARDRHHHDRPAGRTETEACAPIGSPLCTNLVRTRPDSEVTEYPAAYDARELIGTAGDDEPVSMRPFDAITFSLGELWD